MQQFVGYAPVFITRAMTFERKARLFPGAILVIGADTAERLLSPRYYESDEARMYSSLVTIRNLRCRFLVAGRIGEGEQFKTLSHLTIPSMHHDLFEGIDEKDFRCDVSSKAIRANDPHLP